MYASQFMMYFIPIIRNRIETPGKFDAKEASTPRRTPRQFGL